MGRREPVIPVLRRIAAGRHLKQAKPDDGPPSSAAVSTPRKAEIPITFLGCVYYPWKQLGPIPWLKILTLVNPLVYVGRAGHLPGAVNVPIERLRENDGSLRGAEEMHSVFEPSEVGPEKTVIVYCTIANRASQA
jgi:hypothetical protein